MPLKKIVRRKRKLKKVSRKKSSTKKRKVLPNEDLDEDELDDQDDQDFKEEDMDEDFDGETDQVWNRMMLLKNIWIQREYLRRGQKQVDQKKNSFFIENELNFL